MASGASTATNSWRRPGRVGSLGVVAGAYTVAVLAGLAVLGAMDAHPVTEILVADLVATVVIFGASVLFDNTSMYDAYWSVIPPLVVLGLIEESVVGTSGVRQDLVLGVVIAWAIRLTMNWARGWSGLDHEDWRYVAARHNGKPYWPQSFALFHVVPTFIVFGALLPTVPAVLTSGRSVGILDYVAVTVGLGAVALEFVADEQLRSFNARKMPGQICTVGVWAWCRHPNYLGEMLFWWSLYLFGLAADPTWWWTIIGPLAVTAMFVFGSIPMIDDRSRERRSGYEDHMKAVPAFIPRPPR